MTSSPYSKNKYGAEINREHLSHTTSYFGRIKYNPSNYNFGVVSAIPTML